MLTSLYRLAVIVLLLLIALYASEIADAAKSVASSSRATADSMANIESAVDKRL